VADKRKRIEPSQTMKLNLPPAEQKEILEKTLAEFSEGEKNRDDVAVLGVRV